MIYHFRVAQMAPNSQIDPTLNLKNFEMENKNSINHENGNDGNSLIAPAVEPFLPLALGLTYKTRGGDKVTIKDLDYYYSMPFFGDIVTKENKHIVVASFNAAGQYKAGEQSQFDIVGLWNERP